MTAGTLLIGLESWANEVGMEAAAEASALADSIFEP